MMQTVLFIGGPEHGKFIMVPDKYDRWEVVDPRPQLEVPYRAQENFSSMAPITTTVYSRVKLRTSNGPTYDFFVPREWEGHVQMEAYIIDGLMQIARSKR